MEGIKSSLREGGRYVRGRESGEIGREGGGGGREEEDKG